MSEGEIGNVVGIHGRNPVVYTADPVPEVVDILEEYLAMAKAGVLISVAVAAIEKGGDGWRSFHAAGQRLAFVGEIGVMLQEVNQRIIDEG